MLSLPSEQIAAPPSYREWPAALSPRDAVACLWVSRPSLEIPFRVVPDACIDIIWDGTDIFVAGPDTGPVLVPPEPGLAFAGIRFRPGKAPAFLGAAASALLDDRVGLADLWGRAATERLAERLGSAPGPETAARMLDRAVAERARTAPASDPIVDGLVRLL